MREAMMRRGGRPSRNLERLFFALACFALLGTFRLHKTVISLSQRSSNTGPSSSSSSWSSYWRWAFRRETPLYVAAPVEEALIQNLNALGYNTGNERNASGCEIWHLANSTIANASLVKLSKDLNAFRKELSGYAKTVRDFAGVAGDLRMNLTDSEAQNHEICKSVDLHPQGIKGLFPSGQLSFTSSGFVEPLFPPMRDPEFCFPRDNYAHDELNLMNPEYLVHDFGAMCRKLKKTSRIVFVDMGASLGFHAEMESPAMFLIKLFRKFGFHFDHVYAYEIQPTPPEEVFERIPLELLPAYHWINVGVNATPGHGLNPFTTLLMEYNEDDLIIVKLDIDTPSLEMSLAQQLLLQAEHDNNNTATSDKQGEKEEVGNNNSSSSLSPGPRLRRLIDQFYFEHHVHLTELAHLWGEETMQGSVKDTMELFYSLRKHGIPAHFWV